MTCRLKNFKNLSTDSFDMKSGALDTWHLVHVPMVIYSKGDLLYCLWMDLKLECQFVMF